MPSEKEFIQLLNEHQRIIHKVCNLYMDAHADREDLFQEITLQAWKAYAGFRGDAKFSTWLYRITITKSLDHERRKKRKKRFAFVKSLFGDESEIVIHPPDFNHPGVVMDKKEDAAALFNAIGQLPENQRLAFTLHKVEGLSYQEVSEVMRTTVSSVESLMHRARINLKKILEVYYKEKD